MLNRVTLIGRLTREVDLRYTSTGKAVANVSLAVNRKSGEKEEVCFVELTIWDKRAQAFAEHHKKGDLAFVEGSLTMDKWTDEATGKERTKLKVTVNNWEFVSAVVGRSLDSSNPKGKEPDF